jgi:hypothetical protein
LSTPIAIADAVTASLNAGTFSLPIQAQRLHQPSFTLDELKDLHVSVVPRSVAVSAATRETSLYDVAVDVGVQKKIAAAAEGEQEIDDLLNLVEELGDHLRLKRLPDFPEAAWVSIAHEPIVAAEHLDQHRQFTSIITVTYRVRR